MGESLHGVYLEYHNSFRLCVLSSQSASLQCNAARSVYSITATQYSARVSSLPKGGFHGNYGNPSGSATEAGVYLASDD